MRSVSLYKMILEKPAMYGSCKGDYEGPNLGGDMCDNLFAQECGFGVEPAP